MKLEMAWSGGGNLDDVFIDLCGVIENIVILLTSYDKFHLGFWGTANFCSKTPRTISKTTVY